MGRTTVINTELEKNIDLGVAWPYTALQEGECLIASSLRSEWDGVEVGDTVWIDLWEPYTWNAVGAEYNITATEQGWPLLPMFTENYKTSSFKVAGFFDESYGKWPADAQPGTLAILEYNNYL